MSNPLDNLGDYGKFTTKAKEFGGVGPWLDQIGANAVEKAAPGLISKGRGEGALFTLSGMAACYVGYRGIQWAKEKYDEHKEKNAEKLRQLEESDAILRQEIADAINLQSDESDFTSNETNEGL